MAGLSKLRRVAWVVWMLALPLHAQSAPPFVRLPAPRDGVIVEFRDAEPAALERFRRDVGAMASWKTAGVPMASIRREYSVVFHGAALRVERGMLPAIAALPYVAKIHSDEAVHALAGRAPQRQLARALGPHGLATRGEGVVVAVIDSGIDYTHPALGGGLGPGFKVAGGYDFVNRDDDPRDDNGHGTHVAGIIAADSAEMTGLAPGVTLLAYKVLDAYGWGEQSDVVAALERAVDPNGDGDPADHVDVVNLSLGGTGTPDDAQSLAVDAATAAGVIVCVAAGNEGDSFAILSPGTARTAITAGAASEDGRVAWFSSRGPSVKLVNVKPDVLAPGVNVRSTFPGRGFQTMDGTSMATPHVAAACALLHALHAEWTPRQVKAAITMTAVPLDTGVMAQGAGLLDAAAATAAPLLASESHFDFGLHSQQGETWRRTRTISVTNIAGEPVRYDVMATSMDGAASVRALPAVLELMPDASGTITLTVVIESGEGITNASPVQHGGSVTLSRSGVSVHFPWAVLTASRAVMTVEQPYGSFHLLSPMNVRQPLWLSPNTAEVYVAAGWYQVAGVGYDWNVLPANVSFVSGSKWIEGDGGIHFARSDAPHAITLRGTDERGLPIATAAERYLGRFRIYTPPLTPIQGFDLLTADGVLSTNTLPAGFVIKAAEAGADPSANRIVTLQYPARSGVSQGETFAAAAVDLKRQHLRFVFAGGAARRQVGVYSVAIEAVSFDSFGAAAVAAFDVFASSWEGDLYANEEFVDGHMMATELRAAETGRAADIVTAALRVRNGRFVASSATDPSPLLRTSGDDEAVTYGDGPARIAPHVRTSAGSLHTCATVFGAAGETRPRALEDGRLTVFDSGGRVVVQQQGSSIDTTLVPPGPQRVEFVTRGLSTDRLPMRAALSVSIDSTSADATPPAITSIAVVDAANRMTSTLKRGEAGALLFTAADSDATAACRAVAGEATRVWFRWSGDVDWLPLATLEMGDDCDRTSAPLGLQYRVDLHDATARGGTAVDLRLTAVDPAGNITTLTLEPAFTVMGPSGRRRAVAHP